MKKRPKLTPQDVLDIGYKHCIEQGCRSYGDTPDDRQSARCLYRGPNGISCIVGCFIHDGEYASWMDTVGDVGSLINHLREHPKKRLLKLQAFLKKHQSLLASMQSVHDGKNGQVRPLEGEAFRESIREGLAKVAELHGLLDPRRLG